MKRTPLLPILLLSLLSSACATARDNSETRRLATLMGSLRALEAEAQARLAVDPRPEVYREVVGVAKATIEGLRQDQGPADEMMAAVPCDYDAQHCPDSKCASVASAAYVCGPTAWLDLIVFLNATPGEAQLVTGLAATFNLLEMEIMLRYAHLSNRAMSRFLHERLAEAHARLRLQKMTP